MSEKSQKAWSKDPDTLRKELLAAAAPFTSLKEWYRGHNASYAKAQRNGLHRAIAAELGWKYSVRTVWPKDREELFAELVERAKPFDSPAAWQRGDQASYQKAYTEKMQHDVAAHLGWEMTA